MKVDDYRASQVMVDSTAYAITSVTSGLVLICGVSSFLILLGLHQRDRFYELGVLRALGYSKVAVFLALSLDALVLIVMGLLTGLVGSIAGTYLFDLGNINTLLARNGRATVEVGLVSVLLAVITSYRTSNSQVMRLLSVEPGMLPGSRARVDESGSKSLRHWLLPIALLALAICFIVVKATVMRGSNSEGLKAYDDVRVLHGTSEVDVSNMNLTRAGSIIPTLTFNLATRWPSRMPEGCDPLKIMEDAANPGLGIRALHVQGLTGEGVAVAIIDQPLYQDHPEFVGKIAMYKDFGCESESSMHGPAVTSLLVGENCGTAPGASVYYAAVPSWHTDAMYFADALDWLVSVSKELPEGQKIRVVSVSAILSGEGSEFANGEEWDEAVANAEKEGILVLDATRDTVHGIVAPCYYDPADPENVRKCTPGYPNTETKYVGNGYVCAPCSPRTTAEEYVAGDYSYQYGGSGGLSWSIPYTAGVLALGWQIDPNLTPDEAVEILFESAYKPDENTNIIDPAAFVAAVRGRSVTDDHAQ